MPTTIKITPPGKTQLTVLSYSRCTTARSSSDRAGLFSLEIPDGTGDLVDTFPVGSDVQITQDDELFRGWIIKPAKILNGIMRTISIEGADYTARTQKIVVTESYTNQTISAIVLDLFAKYAPWVTVTHVEVCAKLISIRFPDVYLWDAMDQLCKLSGFEWNIDENLDVHFFMPGVIINSNIISQALRNFRKGTANLAPDSSRLVNRLWVKGGKALSNPFTQSITVSTTPIPLYYQPRATIDGVTVTIDGISKTIGIQNIDPAGSYDFLLNFGEKLLIPDLCTSGSGTIIYAYEYPIKLLVEDKSSQATYGIFEDILKVDTDDRSMARELGIRYLSKYAQPVITGSIEPLSGAYRPGELVQVTIPGLNTDEYLQVKEIVYESVPGVARVNRRLTLESRERDLTNILQDINNRLMKVEQGLSQDEGGSVEKLILSTAAVAIPRLAAKTNYTLHQYLICTTGTICGTEVMI